MSKIAGFINQFQSRYLMRVLKVWIVGVDSGDFRFAQDSSHSVMKRVFTQAETYLL